jgi:dimethylhistidine N-methyltransferase
MTDTSAQTLCDLEPTTDNLHAEVVQGLQRTQKTLPSKFLYDRRGSQLFDRICELEEYYPTRTELAIMRKHAGEMASHFGPRCLLIEYGSGSSLKTRLLLDHLEDPVGYVPVDISRAHLLEAAARLSKSYPDVEMLPVCADFTEPFEIPESRRDAARRVGFFPGSTIGNFTKPQSVGLLDNISEMIDGGGLLIGVDLKKDTQTLTRAYNDRHGVTAAFNLNVLRRLNRELDADFSVEAFRHEARYEPALGRVEMHLVSRADQVVRIRGRAFAFRRGESIHTENSHKFSLEDFRDIAAQAGLSVERVWLDEKRLFSVQYLVQT